MTYKLNGVALDPQPTTGQWLPRESLGVDGAGRPIYYPTRSYEVTFNLLSATGFSVLQNNWLSIAATGTKIIDLPKYGSSAYEFTSYTGCYIQEPQAGPFFTQHYQDVRLIITNIITDK